MIKKISGQQFEKLKSITAKKFAQGKISFQKLTAIIGIDDANKIKHFIYVAKKSFQNGI